MQEIKKSLFKTLLFVSQTIPIFSTLLKFPVDLFIDENAFSGTLPGCLGNLSKLKSKRLHAFKNQLSGNVPTTILKLSNLVELGIEENDISGGVDEVCEARLEP